MPRALLSVSDKSGLVDFARGLKELGWEVLSTGGTARTLRAAGIDVIDVSDVTQHAEMLEGRVKTLHPAIHAGLLARRHQSEDVQALHAQGYSLIDLVAVNLYPFHEAVAAGAELGAAMEQVDIGGPSMLRSAAKNYEHVIAISDPADYGRVLEALRQGGIDGILRRELAARVFEATSRYDRAIAEYFRSSDVRGDAGSSWSDRLSLEFSKVQDLRYGENPDQAAAFYAERAVSPGSLAQMRQLQGKELSFNNLLDIDAALMSASAWADSKSAACTIVKHTTPCGVALGASAVEAYDGALACDPVSAFGGVIAFNCAVSAAVADRMATTFYEIVIAPHFDTGALDRFKQRKNLRVIELPITVAKDFDFKRVSGGLLAQDRLRMEFPESDWTVVTNRTPDASELVDLRFAWRVCAAVKSNAIVLARVERTLGIGAGQMSRVDAARIAVMKAHDQSADLTGAVLASDAFFPFRDGIDAAALAGIKAVIQPGGSLRDPEVITAANEHGMAMLFTGRRVFRH
ncbi:MAG: bifunctional phosphoribosylaminoimidazolecarboxamide formyltransferase/IMP cyclohydrolase [Longimicrobiales bacterium]